MKIEKTQPTTFAQFIEQATQRHPKIGQSITESLCRGMTPEEEADLLTSLESPLISPFGQDALDLLRYTNGMTDYTFLGYRLFDHYNIIDATMRSGDVYENFITLFEDGCGGRILYREGEVVLFDREETMIYRFENLGELYQFALDAFESGLYYFGYDSYWDSYSFQWNESMIEKPTARLFPDWEDG